MKFLEYLDSNIVGSIEGLKLDIVTFTAGFLQQIIHSENFSTYEKPLQQRIKFISFILHLVHRCDDFNLVYKYLAPLFEVLEQGVTNWEDESYFRQWETEMLSKVEYADIENNVSDNSNEYDNANFNSDSDSVIEPKLEVKEEVDVEEKSLCKISICKNDESDDEFKEPVSKKTKEDEVKDRRINKDGSLNQQYGSRVRLECPECGESYAGESGLTYHRRVKHGVQPKGKQAKMCDECGVAFKDLQQHIQAKHNITWHPCTVEGCDFKTPQDYELKRHMVRKHSDKNVTTCQYCGATTRDLRLHLYRMKCDQPGMVEENLKKKEERVKKPPKPKTERGALRGTLNSHLPTPCPDCGVVFTKRKGMLQHRQYAHLGVKFPCDLCGHQAPTQGALYRHKRQKHEGVKFYCDQCSFNTSEHYQLKMHIKTTHQGIKYNCDQCTFQANSPQVLKNHVLAKHEGVRYQCDQCEYSTTNQGCLRQHVKFKHEGAEFPCGTCEYKATTPSRLKTHIQTMHEGFRLDCPHCPYQAAQPARLREHIAAKHEEHQYVCNLCSFESKSKKSYRVHLKNAHDLKLNDVKLGLVDDPPTIPEIDQVALM